MGVLRLIIYMGVSLWVLHGAMVSFAPSVFVLAAVMNLLPVASFLLCLIQSLLVSGRMEIQKDTVYLHIKKAGIFPVPQARGVLFIRYRQSGESSRERISFPIPAGNSDVTREIGFSLSGSGVVETQRFWVQDFFGFFSLPLWRLKKCSCSFQVYPKLQAMELSASPAQSSLKDLDGEYEKGRRGDDVSEIFQVREYQPGDRLSHVHWKLTAKEQQFMVREFSLPVKISATLIPDFSAPLSQRKFSQVFTYLYDISAELLEEGHPHEILLYVEGEEESYLINEEDHFEEAMARILAATSLEVSPEIYQELLQKHRGYGFAVQAESQEDLARRWFYAESRV